MPNPPSFNILASLPYAEIDRSNRLLADYLAGEPAVGRWFAHGMDAIPALAAGTAQRVHGGVLAEALADYQQELGADERAVAQARRLADPAVAVVTVGQQPGLLGGPLYTLYKALTAIACAEQLAQRTGRPVVPVFWIAADDDDRAEIDHVGCWGADGTLQTLHYPESAGSPGMLVGNLPAGEAGEQVLAQLSPLLEGFPFAAETLEMYRETLAGSRDFGEWFARMLARCLSPLGLVLCDARLPVVRQLAAELMRAEIRQPLRTTVAVNARARELRAAGYHPALTKPSETCNFFLYAAGRRQRVSFRDGAFIAGGARYAPDALLSLLEGEPAALLPNAVLRPVVQEHMFAGAAFIAGPNELGYWAELQPVFEAMRVPMPPVVPRGGATLLTAPQARRLREWAISPAALLQDFDGVRAELLAREAPAFLRPAFAQGEAAVAALIEDLREAVIAIDPTLAPSTLAARQRMLQELERLEHKAEKAVERQSGELTARLERLRAVIFPAHGLQERVLGAPALLARCGIGGIAALKQCFAGQAGKHVLIEC